MAPGETKDGPRRTRRTSAGSSPPKAESAVDYTVTLKAVKTKVVPAADDEFAKDLGEFGTLAELRDAVRKRLQAAEERRSTARRRTRWWRRWWRGRASRSRRRWSSGT